MVNLQPLKLIVFFWSSPQLSHQGLTWVWEKKKKRKKIEAEKWLVWITYTEREEIKKTQGGISTHVWSQWVTKLWAGNPHNQRHNHQFLKVIILFAYNPHTNTEAAWMQCGLNHATRLFYGLTFLLWEWTRGVRRHLFLFHKENLQLQQASNDFPPILLIVIFQVPTAAVWLTVG